MQILVWTYPCAHSLMSHIYVSCLSYSVVKVHAVKNYTCQLCFHWECNRDVFMLASPKVHRSRPTFPKIILRKSLSLVTGIRVRDAHDSSRCANKITVAVTNNVELSRMKSFFECGFSQFRFTKKSFYIIIIRGLCNYSDTIRIVGLYTIWQGFIEKSYCSFFVVYCRSTVLHPTMILFCNFQDISRSQYF